MSEAPIVYFGIGFLLAALLLFGVTSLIRSRLGRLARKRLHAAAPKLMAEIEADMGEFHAQIAMATRRLEVSVEQMKTRTAGQLSEIGRSSEAIARLRAEYGERTIALQAVDTKERAAHEQLRRTEAELAVKSAALTEVDRKLSSGKAELDDLLAFINARDKLVEAERRHAGVIDQLRAENQSLEQQLGQSYDEITKLEQEMATLKRQVEAIWASERMANAVLRERINDVAGEVVRVAHALEGLGSPIDTMLAGKASELDGAIGALTGGNGSIPPSNGGDDSKGSLARRIRAMQKRAARVASAGGL
jgi:chromosome segregation ATPase